MSFFTIVSFFFKADLRVAFTLVLTATLALVVLLVYINCYLEALTVVFLEALAEVFLVAFKLIFEVLLLVVFASF